MTSSTNELDFFFLPDLEQTVQISTDRVPGLRLAAVSGDSPESFTQFGFVSPATVCDDNYSSEEELKEIINSDRQRKKSGGSGSGDRPSSKPGTDALSGKSCQALSRSSTGSSIGLDESGSSGLRVPIPAEKRKWSEMSGCDVCCSDPERGSSSGPCSCDEVRGSF